MADEPLLGSVELESFPGAPFPPGVINAAAGTVRADCGWHIAPEVTETVILDTGCGTVALLPSLRVKTVTEVRDEGGNVLTGWKVRPNGVLKRAAGWPDVIEVDFTHGYPECPDELVAVVAERARRIRGGGVKAESLAGRSVQLDTAPGQTTAAVVARYTLPGRP